MGFADTCGWGLATIIDLVDVGLSIREFNDNIAGVLLEDIDYWIPEIPMAKKGNRQATSQIEF